MEALMKINVYYIGTSVWTPTFGQVSLAPAHVKNKEREAGVILNKWR